MYSNFGIYLQLISTTTYLQPMTGSRRRQVRILKAYLYLFKFNCYRVMSIIPCNFLTVSDQSKIADVFIATDEWQPVKKGLYSC